MEWLWNLWDFLLAFFGPEFVQRLIAFLSFWTYWPTETSHWFIESQFVNRKQRIVHGQGASSINYSTIVFDFGVCQLSLPASLTNYGDGDASRLEWPAERRKKRLGSPSVINEKKHNDGHGNFIKPPARILLGKPVRLGVKQNSACPRNCFKLHPLN